MSIRFGDGVRGRRPDPGTRTVDGSYRSGAGRNDVVVTSEVVEPLLSDVTVDYGAGHGDPQPDHSARLAVASPAGSDLDLRIDVGDPAADDPAAFGVVTATGSQVNESDLAFVHRLAQNANGAGFAFNLSGGAGDDALGLDRPALGSNAPVSHAIAGGTGSDTCYAAPDVAVTGCEQVDTISDALIRMIETTFGTALADVWRQ